MIDIVILTQRDLTAFTLASLLDKAENFRLHLFTMPKMWDEMSPLHTFALQNFRDVFVYQTAFNSYGNQSRQSAHHLARITLQLKEYWKDKPNTMKRVLVCTDVHSCRIFTQPTLDSGQLPSDNWIDDKSIVVPRRWTFINHPMYKDYYRILDIDANETDHMKTIVLLNWEIIKKIGNNKLFFPGRRTEVDYIGGGQIIGVKKRVGFATRESYPDPKLEGGLRRHHDADSYILSASNRVMMAALMKNKLTYAPLYFNGRIDELIRREAIGPKDTINYNVMLRKSYSMSINADYLAHSYYSIPSLVFMAIPFDLYTKQIDNIPINLRNEALNEQLLQKAEKQKKYLRQVVEAGYLLGKI